MDQITSKQASHKITPADEPYFRLLAEAMPNMFWTCRPDGGCNYTNTQWLRYTGLSDEESLGSGWLEALHPDDRNKTLAAWLAALQKQEPFEIEYRLKGQDGTYRWFLARALPVQVKEGELTWIGTSTDIDNQKAKLFEALNGKQQIANSEEDFKTLANSIPSFVWVCDEHGSAIFQNRTFVNYTGLNEDELAAWGWKKILHQDDLESTLAVWQKCINEGGEYRHRYRLRRFDGVYRWYLALGVPVRDEAGKIVRWFGNCTDIDEQTRATELLEGMVKQRTQELLDARDQAVQANKLKSQFLANISHEIRTPMSGILGLTELLTHEDLNHNAKELVDALLTSAQGLLHIVNDLLDFSKLEAGKVLPEQVPFNVREVVETVKANIYPEIKAKGLALEITIDPQIPNEVEGDVLRLRQSLLNLAQNAVKFTRAGKISISAELTTASHELVFVLFTVKDTGIGIPEDAQKILFRPFVQADGSTTRKYGGTGLGLSIVKKTIEILYGEVGFKSREGIGSEFWFSVPLQIRPQGKAEAN